MSSNTTTTTTTAVTNTSPLTDACCTPGSATTYPSNLSFPAGKDVKIAGIDCYSVNESSKNVVIVSTDVFGWQFPNIRQNANQIAAGGFHVVVPDVFAGDAAKVEELDAKGFGWLFGEWFPRNPQAKTAEKLEEVANALKKDGKADSIQAIGYCYGTIGVLHLYKKGLATAGVCAHPTGFNKENVTDCTAPTLFICAQQDQAFTQEIRQYWETTLKAKMAPAKFVDYPGTSHGFAVRDNGSTVEVAARQAAMVESVAFLKQGAAA